MTKPDDLVVEVVVKDFYIEYDFDIQVSNTSYFDTNDNSTSDDQPQDSQ